MKKSVFKASALVLILSFVAKVIGFIKSIIQASYFGASIEMDAFNLVNELVSNIIYMLMTAVSVAFVPLYIQKSTEGGERKGFATKVIAILVLIALIVSAVLIIFAGDIVHLIAPAFNAKAQELSVRFFRVLCIGIVFSLLASMYTSILNSEKHYYFATVCSLVNSVVLILFIILFSPRYGVWALTAAILVSYVFQWIVLYIPGRKFAKISFPHRLRDEAIKILLIQAIPILVGQASIEINQVVDRALLSGVETGAITAVSYSAVLYQFVASIIATPVSTVMFTEMAEAGKERDTERLSGLLKESIMMLALVCIPIIIVTVFNGKDIVEIVYGRGKFDGKAVTQCAEGLIMYIICLLPSSFKTLYSRAYYSLNDTKHPMIIGILEVILNIVLSIILVKRYGITGVVGATAIAAFVFATVMYVDFNRRYLKSETINFRGISKILLSTIVTVAVAFILQSTYGTNPYLNFLGTTIVLFSLFFGILIALKEESVKQLLSTIKNIKK